MEGHPSRPMITTQYYTTQGADDHTSVCDVISFHRAHEERNLLPLECSSFGDVLEYDQQRPLALGDIIFVACPMLVVHVSKSEREFLWRGYIQFHWLPEGFLEGKHRECSLVAPHGFQAPAQTKTRRELTEILPNSIEGTTLSSPQEPTLCAACKLRGHSLSTFEYVGIMHRFCLISPDVQSDRGPHTFGTRIM